ncbi:MULTISPECIES: SIMPL domain-containing protein [unclassified Halomonas]|uniref:SIMPL domain-containing protein n=1 Tax=unclassified Halomonas TaxID=2609666 RepID=UPI000A9960B9|nr:MULTISPECIES: SIMPL domain-containing protein [unclassified Halomonas]MCO7215190.1 SIMPL domain-containing protein [Halomonas sp. OfavH-34-E]
MSLATPSARSRAMPSLRLRHLHRLATVGLGLALASLAATPSLAAESPTPRYLDIQAQSELKVAPDEATLNARLWELTPAIAQEKDSGDHGQALAEARQRLEDRAAELISALEDAGLSREAINAGSLRVQQEMLHQTRQGNDNPIPMVRTRLERPVTLAISDLDSLPTLLDALTEAGVNALDGVSYDLADRDAASDRALTQALVRARAKAELMADALGVELGEVIHVSETNAPVFQPRMMAMRADMAESGGNADYSPGSLTIDAGVQVRWGLAEATADIDQDRQQVPAAPQ